MLTLEQKAYKAAYRARPQSKAKQAAYDASPARRARLYGNENACLCGCGLFPLRRRSKYCHGHWAKTRTGRTQISDWKYEAARSAHGDGYITVRKATGQGHQLEHVHITEKVLGRPLPPRAEVHHVNENPSDNRTSNLVICENRSYHRLLHQRMRALLACGHADWRKCSFCGCYDDPSLMYIPKGRGTIEHRTCGLEYRRQRKGLHHAHA